MIKHIEIIEHFQSFRKIFGDFCQEILIFFLTSIVASMTLSFFLPKIGLNFLKALLSFFKMG